MMIIETFGLSRRFVNMVTIEDLTLTVKGASRLRSLPREMKQVLDELPLSR
jgi:hypothetical protein